VYIGALLGLTLLVALLIRADFAALMHTLAAGGLRLLWLVPYRGLFFLLYAIGWLRLLHPYDPARRVDLGYLTWATAVREGVDRLLPVASVGGGVIGVRLLSWRGIKSAAAAATVIVEMLLTLVVVYIFTALGLLLLLDRGGYAHEYRRLLPAFLITLPAPAVMVLLLKYGSVFQRLHGLLRPFIGEGATSEAAAALDEQLRMTLHRLGTLLGAGSLQLLAFASASFEVWFALRLFGHPVSWHDALILECMTQAMRHLAFFVPAGLGVQEAALIIFGGALGISGEMALAVSMAKRLREILCGLPALLSWQWVEAHRLRLQRSSA
jgi:putative membrane protein